MKRKLLILFLTLSLLHLPVSATTAESQVAYSCKYNTKTDLSEYQLTPDQLEELYFTMLYAGQLPWYATYDYTYYYDEFTGLVLEFQPDLLDDSYHRMAYEQAVAALLDACISESMEPWQQALVLYDYLSLHCAYDDSLQLSTGYDLLLRGSTVCSGYAALYQELLLRLGIPCLQIDSEEMDHVWNLVQLDGSWYHVDLTWGDPAPDTYGLVDHTYFLRTDSQFREGPDPHTGWVTDITCTDTRYTDAFWQGVSSPIVFTDNDTCYYLRDTDCRNSLYRYTVSKDRETALYREPEEYMDLGYGKYTYFHTGLFLREDRLWLCTMDRVISMDLQGKQQREEYRYQGNRYICGCYVQEDTLQLTLSDHNGDVVTETVALSPVERHTHQFTPTVTASTCAAPGYTTALCDCGISAIGDHTAPLDHSWTETGHKPADLFSAGYTDTLCTACGEALHTDLPQVSLLQWTKEHLTTIIALALSVIALLLRILRRRKN